MSKKSSVLKRTRTAKRNYNHNRKYKSVIKTTIKNCTASIMKMQNDGTRIATLNIAKVFSNIDKAVKRKVIHKNKGARKKLIISKLFKKKYAEL